MLSSTTLGAGPIATTVLLPAATCVCPASLIMLAKTPLPLALFANSISSCSELILTAIFGWPIIKIMVAHHTHVHLIYLS